MLYDQAKLVCFDIGNAVHDLINTCTQLTIRDIDNITEQVIYSFIEQSTLLKVGDVPTLEIERLPDSYNLIRDSSACSILQSAFRHYYETIRMILLLFGMEKLFIEESNVYVYERFLSNHTKLVLRAL